MSKKLITALAVVLLLGAGTAYCEAPNLLTYQGRLKESGQPANGNRTVQIRLCSDSAGTTCFNTSPVSQSVSVSSGLFRSTYTVPSTIDMATGVWYLEVTVGGSLYLPREQLAATPYAIYAASASALAAAPNASGAYVSTSIFITGLSSATKYYGDGSALTNVSTHTFKIGDTYGGGIIFWVDSAGKQVLIAPTADQSAGIKWSNDSTKTGASQDGVYAGKANTVIISTMQHSGSYAAQVCADYRATTAGGEYYDDWYLPSTSELSLLYAQKDIVGGFTATWYWSSNEYMPLISNAWYVFFTNGTVSNFDKTNVTSVRCIRAGPSSGFGNLPTNAETVTNGAYTTSTQTFSGSNTFKDITTTSLTVTSAGTTALARTLTQSGTGAIFVTSADFGKTITVNSVTASTVTLPLVTAADIGATVTVIKLNTGKVTIVAPTGNCIADVCDTAALYNDTSSPAYASVTLQLADSIRWVITGSVGTWAQ